jgi:hypothetical protein
LTRSFAELDGHNQKEKSPWLIPSGGTALRHSSRFKEITRQEAIRVVREKILVPAIIRAVPDCLASDLIVTVETVQPSAAARVQPRPAEARRGRHG